MNYDNFGMALTERSEALRLTSYQDQGGVWTNGYGHTGPDVHPGQTITKDQAVAWLQHDTQTAANAVNNSVKVSLTQYQFDALVDFTYNVGVHAFENSTMLRKLNSGDYEAADEDFKSWIFVKGTINRGLLDRRTSEQQEFETKE